MATVQSIQAIRNARAVYEVDSTGIPIAGTSGAGLTDTQLRAAPIAIGGTTNLVSATLTRPATTPTYAAGDAVGGAALTFADCARVAAGSGLIVSALLVQSSAQAVKGSWELWLFRGTAAPTADADDAVFTPTDAELLNLVAVIPFTTAYVGDATAGAGGNVAYLGDVTNRAFKCGTAVDDLYGLVVVRNAYVAIASETLVFILQIVQD